MSVRRLPLSAGSGTLDRTVVPLRDDGAGLVFPPADDDPMTVAITYRVDAAGLPAFRAAMRAVGLSRRRTGGYLWRLERAGSDPELYREEFRVRSWSAYRRAQAERWTASDTQGLDAVAPLRQSESVWFPIGATDPAADPHPASDDTGEPA